MRLQRTQVQRGPADMAWAFGVLNVLHHLEYTQLHDAFAKALTTHLAQEVSAARQLPEKALSRKLSAETAFTFLLAPRR